MFDTKLTLLKLLLATLYLAPDVSAVNRNRYHELKKKELIELDWDVNRLYEVRLDQLELNETNYEQYLFRALRSFRHTTVINHNDYKYSSREIMKKSRGQQVDEGQCLEQLAILKRMLEVKVSRPDEAYGPQASLPLSAVDFLDSYGKVEAGLLNGNNLWLGSYATCSRAKIQSSALNPFQLKSKSKEPIAGRYCVAHMHAKSWPQSDLYFEDRINIKLGLCLPQSCHSILFHENPRVGELVDYLARRQLVAPFNSDRYQIRDLYCMPDEDSQHRQWDFGTWCLIVFVFVWLSLVAYSSLRYSRRMQTVRQLRQSVDIKMIIKSNQSLEDQVSIDDDEAEVEKKQEEEETTFGADESENGQAFDLIKALAVQANLDYLLKSTRTDWKKKKEVKTTTTSTNLNDQNHQKQRLSQQLSSGVTRRTSSSNEALIKDLHQQDGKSKVAIVESNNSASSSRSSSPNLNQIRSDGAGVIGGETITSFSKEQTKSLGTISTDRVNVDLFDGIKAIATIYIVMGHTMMFFFGIVNDMKFADERMFDFTMISIMNTLQVVGLFYIITGALLTYLVFSRQRHQLNRPTFWLLVLIGRYLRLLPVYLLVFWFARHASPHTGSGPHWLDYRTDHEHCRTYCGQESWQVMLTMSAADVKIPLDCVPQTWYLSNDFRTLLILPIYIVILALNPKTGYAAIFATFGWSSWKLVRILREANIDYLIIMSWKPHVFSLLTDRLHDVYTDLAVRLSTYLLGVIVGHLLYLYETRQIRRWPRWFSGTGVKVSLLIGACAFLIAPLIANPYLNQFLPNLSSLNSDRTVFFIPFVKTGMESCICVILLLMATGSGYQWLTNILSSRMAKILSHVSYAVFIVHIEAMYKVPVSKIESSYWFLYQYGLLFLAMSFTLACAIHLLYEMPINNLIRHSMKRMIKALGR